MLARRAPSIETLSADRPGSASTMGKDSDKTFSFKREELRLPALVKNVPCLVVVEGASIGLEVRLDKAEVVIGRAEDADVSVDDRLGSREHAKVIAEGEGESREYFLLAN